MRAAWAIVGAVLVALATAPPALAKVVADTGPLRADVDASPWHLEIQNGAGDLVLERTPWHRRGSKRDTWVSHQRRDLAPRNVGDELGPGRRCLHGHARHRRSVALARGADRAGRQGDRLAACGARGLEHGIDALGIGFEAQDKERYFGFGERSNAHDQRGNTVENYATEGPFQEDERALVPNAFVPGWGFRPRDDAAYYPMPWLLSSAGYGVLIDNTETSYFRLGTDDPDAWSLEVTPVPVDSLQTVVAPAPVTSLDLRFFAGPKPRGVLRRFSAEVGRQPPPEPWFFGPWFQPRSDEANARLLRRSDAPVSVAQTYTHYLPCGSQQGRETTEQERAELFHSLGYAVTTYFNPMICVDYTPVYGQADAAGALTETQQGEPYVYRYNQFVVSQFDFTADAGDGFYGGLLDEALGHGYDGWMEDFGEYHPLDSRSADGTPGTVMHNLYPQRYHCAAWDAVKDEPQQVMRYIRSGWTGAARCAPIVWGGDPTTGWGFDGLRSAVLNGLSMGLSGVGVWGSDIGGFFALFEQELSPELLTRWVQFGAVSGVMRTQADGFQVPEKDRPQVFDPDQMDNWRRWSKFRTQLYPYIRAAAATYRENGLPMMRALVLAYPTDRKAAGIDDEFLFGPDLLAAPVLDPGVTKLPVYLPDGTWIDMWRSVEYVEESGALELGSAKELRGKREVRVPAPLDEMPLFARAGSLFAMLPPDVDTLAPFGDAGGLVHLGDRRNRMELLAFPQGRSSGKFLQKGKLKSVEAEERWRLTVTDNRSRKWDVQASLSTLDDPFKPCAVKVDGKVLRDSAWSYRRGPSVLELEFQAGKGDTKVVVVGAC